MGSRRRRHAVLAAGALALASCGDDDGSAAELCAAVGDGRARAALFEQGFDPTDTDRALAQLRAAQVELGELRAVAPGSQRDAIDDELEYVDALLEIVETLDPDDPAAVVGAVNDLDEERERAEVAALELEAFEAQECRGPATT